MQDQECIDILSDPGEDVKPHAELDQAALDRIFIGKFPGLINALGSCDYDVFGCEHEIVAELEELVKEDAAPSTGRQWLIRTWLLNGGWVTAAGCRDWP